MHWRKDGMKFSIAGFILVSILSICDFDSTFGGLKIENELN